MICRQHDDSGITNAQFDVDTLKVTRQYSLGFCTSKFDFTLVVHQHMDDCHERYAMQ